MARETIASLRAAIEAAYFEAKRVEAEHAKDIAMWRAAFAQAQRRAERLEAKLAELQGAPTL